MPVVARLWLWTRINMQHRNRVNKSEYCTGAAKVSHILFGQFIRKIRSPLRTNNCFRKHN